MSENFTKLISPRVLCTSVTNCVLSWFDRFCGLLQLYERKCHKTHIFSISVHKSQKIVFLADLTVLLLITTIQAKLSKNSKLREICTQVSQIVFLADLTVFAAYYNCMSENVTKIIFFRFLCTKVKNRVLSWFDSFTAYYNYISKNVKKLITPRDLYTSITNRVPMWSDHFTAYSNCMSEKVTKLVSPQVLCTNVAKRVLTWFDRFTAYYNCMSKNVGKLISPRVLCTSVKNRVLRWFNRFTTYYNCISKNVKETHISASSRHKYHKSCS